MNNKQKIRIGIIVLIILSGVLLSVMLSGIAEEYRLEHILEVTSQLVFFGVLLCAGLMLTHLISSMRKQPYAYKNAAMVGGLFFLGFLFITVLIPLCFFYTKSGDQDYFLVQFFGNVLKAIYHFTLLLLPVLIVLFLSLLASNIALLRHEGRNLHHLLGAAVSAFLILFTVLNLLGWNWLTETAFREEGGKAFGQIMLRLIPILGSAVLCYLECVFIGMSFCAIAAAKKRLQYNQDYMIILGCAIRKDGSLYPLLKGRVDHAMAFAQKQHSINQKQLIYIPSGGQGSNECIAEAEAIRRYLLQQGTEESHILPETKSVNTMENMSFSKALIDAQQKANPNVAFSTTNYHVFRAGVYAAQVGLKARGTGSKTKWYFWPNAFVREMIALLANQKWTVLINLAVLIVICIALALLDWRIVQF